MRIDGTNPLNGAIKSNNPLTEARQSQDFINFPKTTRQEQKWNKDGTLTQSTIDTDGSGVHEKHVTLEYQQDGSVKTKSVRLVSNELYGVYSDRTYEDTDGDGFADVVLVKDDKGKTTKTKLDKSKYLKSDLNMKKIATEGKHPTESALKTSLGNIQDVPGITFKKVDKTVLSRQAYLSQKYNIETGRKDGNICRTVQSPNGDKILIYQWAIERDEKNGNTRDYTKCEIKQNCPKAGYTTIIDYQDSFPNSQEALDKDAPSVTIVINNKTGKVVEWTNQGKVQQFPDD